jgi:RNA recognition motif-containing protein
MNKKLYIGNLSYDTTEAGLRELFEAAGTVASVNLITDRETGRPRGFAFVEMESADGAKAAIEELNNRELDGRTITVAEARPPRERSFGGGDRGGSRGGPGGPGGPRGGQGQSRRRR